MKPYFCESNITVVIAPGPHNNGVPMITAAACLSSEPFENSIPNTDWTPIINSIKPPAIVKLDRVTPIKVKNFIPTNRKKINNENATITAVNASFAFSFGFNFLVNETKTATPKNGSKIINKVVKLIITSFNKSGGIITLILKNLFYKLFGKLFKSFYICRIMETKTIEGIVSGVTIIPLTNDQWVNCPTKYTAWVSLSECDQSSGFYLPTREQSDLERYSKELQGQKINADLDLIKDKSYVARHLVVIRAENYQRSLF